MTQKRRDIWFDDETWAALKVAASAAGVTVSALVRSKLHVITSSPQATVNVTEHVSIGDRAFPDKSFTREFRPAPKPGVKRAQKEPQP